ncbi:glycosyltransferase [Halodesulfurarchaeum sp. HSR-GB]|uniref:glycosyltransferase n=1 Tax=Halodesulfurarchaeum sp. HSR-GB TaxID=3074077 RepID=UPI00285B2138|nr:glycosyltransferase [Halodesulfurarchaeum sp. HSR-GB]MDR5657038.1 glycosyltransferase [Halodesulfurarchaeum sp. HSR-GB]
MPPAVAAFTDTYLPTVNGVTYTISAWRDRYIERDGRMDVVYPSSSYDPAPGEHPVRSFPFPFYEGYRLGVPSVPESVADVDLVHAHSPFAVGVAGYRLARRESLPFVVSYHTPTAEYASYVAPGPLAGPVAAVSSRWEQWFLERADLVLAPSDRTARSLRKRLHGVVVEDLPNGVDTTRFEPQDPTTFKETYGLPMDRPLVGYTGRHGHEKNLGAIIDAVEPLDVTVVFGGEGPATQSLREAAAAQDVDARFLGFLDREELPAFYSALDVFAFPSPVETQGIVALEATACGTPVVGVNAGALRETIVAGETGYHYERGDIADFRDGIQRALAAQEQLAETCLAHRSEISLSNAITQIETAYDRVR